MSGRELYWLAIGNLPYIGPTLGSYLWSNGFDPEEFWEADQEKLMSAYDSSQTLAAKIHKGRKGIDPGRILRSLEKRELGWVTIESQDYPEKLKKIPNPPTTIYFRGELSICASKCVAVVGSRRPTAYGKQITSSMARELSLSGLVIVSGLAMGIDAIAHHAALEKGTTIAVLGCGIDIAYPASNRSLYEKTIANGCVVSEYPPGTDPLPFRFPARNRIISGLSNPVIVTEANSKSGALLTADYALEQGKDVCAVPGNILSPLSRGPHKLLKNGAILIENAGDVLDILALDKTARRQAIAIDLENEEALLLDAISYTPVHIDDLIANQEMRAEKVAALLSILEIKGFVSQDVGKVYQRCK